jgi:1,2-diacylglycerol 3-beta-galactosyltransferase
VADLRTLILMADTGGGHRAAAQAVAEGLELRFGGRHEVTILDAMAKARWPVSGFGAGYGPLVEHLPAVYGRAWHLSDNRPLARAGHALLAPLIGKHLGRVYRDLQPDLVVSVHPMLTRSGLGILRAQGSMSPFATVVTDLFDAHGMWFEGRVDRLIVPTEGAALRAEQAGQPRERIAVLGQPIRAAFAEPGPGKAALRTALGLRPELPTAILVGGGDGVGRLGRLARAVAEAGAGASSSPDFQLVVICGRNESLKSELEAADWPIPVHATGFVDNMADWMRASDLMLTKAGPGSIMEALAAGLPLLLHGHLPGQEEGNVRFVLDHALGERIEDPAALAARTAEWLAPASMADLAERQARASAHARPGAALDIADALDALTRS